MNAVGETALEVNGSKQSKIVLNIWERDAQEDGFLPKVFHFNEIKCGFKKVNAVQRVPMMVILVALFHLEITFSNVFYCLTAPPPGILTCKNQSLQHRGIFSVQGFFCENSISPVQGQSFAHRGTLKTQSPHTPQHRAHTNGNFENSKSSHATAQSPHS